MSFFQHIKPEESEPEEEKVKRIEQIDPRMIIIDGGNLIKLVEDNPAIAEGKTDRGIARVGMWVPVNYNPETGEML